ncbi:Quinone oxidoreductase-like protein 1 [Takifugu flavidus]|uniref:Quinone oxidoreductase-like protein 1 n=1 Tax=Takifugu flavidus TaxID=433684 RepID=A0A5C6PF97_9TELE|nr:Quinone oxidoreductase-like protein 1 [Takifugu flavidus]
MKGLYCRAGVSDAKPKFVIQETSLPEVLNSHLVRVQVKACGLHPLDLELLSDVGIQTDLIPVGREIAGVILQVGDKVSFFQPDDEVVGILPLDFPFSGLCDVIDIDEQYLVQKPEKLSSVCVAGALRDGVCAYTALHTHARVAAGNTILVFDGASVSRVIPVYNGASDLLSVVLEETGGLGVDVVVDCGVRLQGEESEERKLLPHKHDIISALAVGGHWVTSHKDLQLDPPDSRLLFLRSASVSFLNHEVWTASSAQQGRYLRILNL